MTDLVPSSFQPIIQNGGSVTSPQSEPKKDRRCQNCGWHAYAIGSDSLDSSFPLWSKERMKLFGFWVDGLAEQRNFTFAERCTTLQGVA